MGELLPKLSIGHMALALFVASRIAGMVISMPFLLRSVSWRIRIILVLAVAAVIVPNLSPPELNSLATAGEFPFKLFAVEIAINVGRELILGMVIGGVVALLISGVLLAGELIVSIVGLPRTADQSSPDQLPTLSKLIGLMVTAVMFAVGGHRYLMKAMLDSFSHVAPGSVSIDSSLIDMVITQLTAGMWAGVRVAAPILAATLVTQLLVALVSRTMSGIHVLAVGINLNILVMLVVTAITIGSAGLLFQRELISATEQLYTMW